MQPPSQRRLQQHRNRQHTAVSGGTKNTAVVIKQKRPPVKLQLGLIASHTGAP
jgi:hypothetical protein